MAQTTVTGTAAAAHLEGIDFAGKTGTAQVVNHSAGATSLGKGSERANAWFVGMAPRRNPDIVVAVLWEHGGWGAGSAPMAAQIINTFVTKQRKQQNNLREIAPPQLIASTHPAEPMSTGITGTAASNSPSNGTGKPTTAPAKQATANGTVPSKKTADPDTEVPAPVRKQTPKPVVPTPTSVPQSAPATN